MDLSDVGSMDYDDEDARPVVQAVLDDPNASDDDLSHLVMLAIERGEEQDDEDSVDMRWEWMVRTLAVHPTLAPRHLESLGLLAPDWIAENPALPLLALTDPSWAQRLLASVTPRAGGWMNHAVVSAYFWDRQVATYAPVLLHIWQRLTAAWGPEKTETFLSHGIYDYGYDAEDVYQAIQTYFTDDPRAIEAIVASFGTNPHKPSSKAANGHRILRETDVIREWAMTEPQAFRAWLRQQLAAHPHLFAKERARRAPFTPHGVLALADALGAA